MLKTTMSTNVTILAYQEFEFIDVVRAYRVYRCILKISKDDYYTERIFSLEKNLPLLWKS